jgi:hypothetical protein
MKMNFVQYGVIGNPKLALIQFGCRAFLVTPSLKNGH